MEEEGPKKMRSPETPKMMDPKLTKQPGRSSDDRPRRYDDVPRLLACLSLGKLVI